MDYTKLDQYMVQSHLVTDEYTKETEQTLQQHGHAVFTDALIDEIIANKDSAPSNAIASVPSLPSRLTPTSFRFLGQIDMDGSKLDDHAMLQIDYLWLGAKKPVSIRLEVYRRKQENRFALSFSDEGRAEFYMAMEEDENNAAVLAADVKTMLSS